MRNLLRFIAISRIVARYRLDHLVLLTKPFKAFKPLLYLLPWHYLPSKKRSRAERIRLALEELGPIFIKFGQVLSTRRDLLPNDIGDELAKLQDTCPIFDPLVAKQMIAHSLGKEIDVLFKQFDEQPLASASIAQAHSAITFDGDEVVVKIVRPNIDAIIKRDIALMYFVAKLINKHPASQKIRPLELVAEFEAIILNELDMLAEAQNATLLRKNFANSNLLYVPKVHWDLCSKNVLTTERIYGTPVSDIAKLKANNVDLKKLAEDGVIIFFTQVFKHNFFHADMHPGNIFVGKNGNYIGVDFGIMGSLSETDKDFLAELFLAFFNQDYQKVAQTYVDSGWASAATDVDAFTYAVQKICAPMFEKPLAEISFGQVLLELINEAKNFDISVQPQLLLLDKTLLNIEGLGRQLYPQLDLWATAKPFLEDLLSEKNTMKNAFEQLKKSAPELLKDLPKLPEMTINAIKQLDKIKTFPRLHAQQTNAIINQLKNNSKRQTNAIFSGALIILSGIFALKTLWLFSIISGIFAVWFWLKSK